ncbi:protein kinase family protein [Streptomyces ureilyticus]|uniref:Aminoglycoside phosphotransferase n=1 Tax=Streptomyces ureilyticus TaxID=1775131 RepID=A0ABX0DM66_9ACTN|nr:aminoglycoside phosphotransferase [Streptomyces ureilyticus]NGO40789.1 aminoglycoside phosphotransferase [Streptomyces ureilyticus]
MPGPPSALSPQLADEVREIFQVPPIAAEFEPLTHNPKNGVTAGVWRVSVGDRSAVLKVLTRGKDTTETWASSDDPRHWNFWRREAYVYEEGVARVWEPWGITAPELLASVERPDGDVALWLEDVRGEPATGWSTAAHAGHARRLGAAHGRALAERAEPLDHPWLSRRFLRDYTAAQTTGRDLLDDDTAWQQPLVRDHFPEGLREDMVRLRHEREWFLSVMESLPRVFSHLDQWPANLTSPHPGQSVLFDWAFAGDGALGEDIGNYIPDTIFDGFLPAARLPELATAAYEGYVRGLRDSGWQGDVRLVRLGMCASAVKYDWLTALMLSLAGDAQQLDYGGRRTVEAEHRYRERGVVLGFLADWAREARVLATELGFPH